MEGDRIVARGIFKKWWISIHSLRMEGDLQESLSNRMVCVFQSTPSAWRETVRSRYYRFGIWISIHSLRMEGDLLKVEYKAILCISIHSLRMEGDIPPYADIYQRLNFNPLPPHGGRRMIFRMILRNSLFQSTPSAWRETEETTEQHHICEISIHSLRMEGDPLIYWVFWFIHISIHSLRMEGDSEKL